MDKKNIIVEGLKKAGRDLYHIDTDFHSKCEIKNCLTDVIGELDNLINNLEGNKDHSTIVSVFVNLVNAGVNK